MNLKYYPEGADLEIKRVLKFAKKTNKPIYNQIKGIFEQIEEDLDAFKKELKRNEDLPKSEQVIRRLDDIHPRLYELRIPPSDRAAVYRIYFGFDITKQTVILLSAERKTQGTIAKNMIPAGCSLAEYIKNEEN